MSASLPSAFYRSEGQHPVDPLFKEITEIFPDVTPMNRTSTHA